MARDHFLVRQHGTAEIASPPILTGIRPDDCRSTDNLLPTGAVFKPPPKPRRRELDHHPFPPIAAWHLRVYANIYVYYFAWGAHLSQHLSRKELKTDEVRDTLAHGADAVLSHKQLTLYILLAAVLVALGVFGWQTYTERQTVKATAAYDDAMKTFQARIRTASEPAQPGETTYID